MLNTTIATQIYAKISFETTQSQKKIIEQLADYISGDDFSRIFILTKEEYSSDTPQEMIPSVLSEVKSFGFHRPLDADEILITSDTLVLCEGRVMGKPRSLEDAVEMLEHLSGKDHKVITAITLRDNSIRNDHASGVSVALLSRKYHLSEKSIRRILQNK